MLWVLAAAALAVARVHPAIHHVILVISSGVTVDRLRAYVAASGPWAPAVSVVVMVLQTFLPFPADPLIMANGAVFGIWEGLLVSIVGAQPRRVQWADAPSGRAGTDQGPAGVEVEALRIVAVPMTIVLAGAAVPATADPDPGSGGTAATAWERLPGRGKRRKLERERLVRIEPKQ